MPFRVNPLSLGTQQIFGLGARSVASVGSGFVVAYGTETLGRFQVFDGAGVRLTGERWADAGLGLYSQMATPVTVAGSGTRFMIVGAVATDGSNDVGIRGQIFDAAGIAVSQPFDIPSATLGEQNQPSVVGDGAGGFVVGFTTIGGTNETFVRRFDQNGNPIELYSGLGHSNQVSIRSTLTNSLDQIDLARTSSGISATFTTTMPMMEDDIHLVNIPFSGPPSNEVLVNTILTAGKQSQPAIASLPGNKIAVVWQSANGDGDSDGISAAILSDTGAILTSEFLVNTTTISTQYSPAVIALGTNFLVVWRDNSTSPVTIRSRLFDSTGVALTPETTVSTNASFQFTHLGSVDVGLLPDGGYLITWNENGDVVGQRYDASGNPVTMPELFIEGVNQTLTGSAGNDVFRFTHNAIAAGDSIVGSGGSDTLFLLDAGGYNLSAAAFDTASTYVVDTIGIGIFGYNVTLPGGISTTYLGGAAPDLVTAISGTHTVFVGTGHNQVITGTGTATMTTVADGGFLDVTYGSGGGSVFGGTNTGLRTVANSGAVTVSGSAEGGTHTGSSAADKFWVGSAAVATLGGGNDLLVGTTGRQTVQGGLGADTLFAGPSGAVLDGGSGSDVIVGSAATDLIAVGPGDTVWGGAGADSFALSGTGNFMIADFDPAFDQLWLGGLGFSSLTALNSAAVGGGPAQASNGWVWTLTSPAITLSVVSLQPIPDSAVTGGIAVVGTTAASTITGTASNDFLRADYYPGIDKISGGGGADTVHGGVGRDTLTGGSGPDKFTYRSNMDANVFWGGEVITDFNAAEDAIILSRFVFGISVPFDANPIIDYSVQTVAANSLSDVVSLAGLAVSTSSRIQTALVTASGGSLTGTYLVVADSQASVHSSDMIIELTGVSGAPTVLLDPYL